MGMEGQTQGMAPLPQGWGLDGILGINPVLGLGWNSQRNSWESPRLDGTNWDWGRCCPWDDPIKNPNFSTPDSSPPHKSPLLHPWQFWEGFGAPWGAGNFPLPCQGWGWNIPNIPKSFPALWNLLDKEGRAGSCWFSPSCVPGKRETCGGPAGPGVKIKIKK